MKNVATWEQLLYPGNSTDFFAREKFPSFDPDAGGYSQANALWLAELSRLVYRHDREEGNPPPEPTRTSFLEKADFSQKSFHLCRETDTQAMLVERTDGAFAVLAFRGTEQTIQDYLTDIEVGRFAIRDLISDLEDEPAVLSDEKIEIHEGFLKALDSVWGSIEISLRDLKCPVFFTGHSLGAALATISSTRIKPRAVYTFGSPRAGNQEFADSLSGIPIYRVVDDEDIVTTVPPEELGYVHVGEAHRLAAPPGTYSIGELFELIPPKPLDDHAPVNYVDRIMTTSKKGNE